MVLKCEFWKNIRFWVHFRRQYDRSDKGTTDPERKFGLLAVTSATRDKTGFGCD